MGKQTSEFRLTRIMLAFVFLCSTTTTAFFIRWPWSVVYPAALGGTTAATAAASVNYGFLRPTILLPVTTPAPTTTTTTTARPTTTSPLNQLFINALLGTTGTLAIPANNSQLLINLAGALAAANRPVVGGVAQPFPGVPGGAFGGGGVVGGIAAPITGGAGGVGGITIPSGFPAGGGILASGVLPGFPFQGGVIGRSAERKSNGGSQGNSGKVIFASRKKK